MIGREHEIRADRFRFVVLAFQHACNHDCSSLFRGEYRRAPYISDGAYDEDRLARFYSRGGNELVAGSRISQLE